MASWTPTRTSILFSKYEGAGNDFILIDDLSLSFSQEWIVPLCRSHFGIGADGLILAQPSLIADARMRYFNADGSEAALCGNGLRCLAHFLGRPQVQIETGAGIFSCLVSGDIVDTELGEGEIFEQFSHGNLLFTLVKLGVRHAVCIGEEFDLKISQEVRHLKDANVNWVQSQGGKELVRTFEKGVEAETFSCGTGVAASCFALGKEGSFSVQTGGGEKLECLIEGKKVRLKGAARLVFEGEVFLPL